MKVVFNILDTNFGLDHLFYATSSFVCFSAKDDKGSNVSLLN